MRGNHNNNPFDISGTKKYGNYFVADNSKRKFFEVDLFSGKKDTRNNSLNLLISPKIITRWLIVLLIGIFGLGIRTAYLQLVRGEYYGVVAEGNRIRIKDIKAPRGVIYDRHQNLLVENISSFSLAVVKVDLPNEAREIEEISSELAKISRKSAGEIKAIIGKESPYSYQPVILEENLDQDRAIMTEILHKRYPGVILYSDATRNYLKTDEAPSLSHILGYVGKIEENQLEDYLNSGYLIDDHVGKAGLEFFYENELKGVNGREQVEVDAIGAAKEVIASERPIPGNNLILTIDSELQAVAEKSLQKALSSYGKRRGAVIIMDPNSGEVLAMVSLPTFDNNIFSRGISREDFSKLINDPDKPLYTRAISGEYPSGSTFKMIVGAAALEEGIINSWTGFSSVGGIRVNQWFFPDWKFGGHGWTTITKALAESVNTFFYTIGGGYEDFVGLGVEKIKAYAVRFGLTQKLGIDLPNEAAGFFPSIAWKEKTKGERWYVGDTYNLSIGQGDILITPLQLALWTSTFANGGTVYKPYVVKEILDAGNSVSREIKPRVLNEDFIRPENIDLINKGLRDCVIYGSCVRFSALPVAVAAKTGTAQWSSIKEPHGWLTAFAPYNDPQVVVTVLVEEGEGGNTTAVPVAYDILEWWTENR